MRERTQVANRIHAQILGAGLRLERGRLLTEEGRRWVHRIAWPRFGPEQQRLVETHFELLDKLSGILRGLDRQVDDMAGELPAARLLQTIPGVGSYRSLLIATEVMPIDRFPRPAHLVSYAGLAPTSRQSGLRAPRHGSLPAGANRWLRGAFVRTIVSHCQNAPDSWLSEYYARHKDRLNWRVARVAAARKLARAVHAMLRTGEVWRNTHASSSAPRGESRSGPVAQTT